MMTGLWWKKYNLLIIKYMSMHRYLMGWSQAECGWIVVYAHDLEEAQEKYECGEYRIEEE